MKITINIEIFQEDLVRRGNNKDKTKDDNKNNGKKNIEEINDQVFIIRKLLKCFDVLFTACEIQSTEFTAKGNIKIIRK